MHDDSLMSDSGWSDYDDEDLESMIGGVSPRAKAIPTSPTVSAPSASKTSPRTEPTLDDSPDITNFASSLLDHPRWRKDASVLYVGFLTRRTRLTGMHELKFVEIRGGLLRYYDVPGKNFALSPKNSDNDRVEKLLTGPATELSLLGASVASLSEQSFVISFPFKFDTRPIRPRIFRIFSTGPLKSETSRWIDAVEKATHWRIWASQLRSPQPFKRRVCGIITVHVLHVNVDTGAKLKQKIDPYVVARFGDVRARTRTVFNHHLAHNDIISFDEYLNIPVEYDNPNWSVMVRVMDESLLAGDGLVGVCALPLHSLGLKEERVWQFPMYCESGTTRTGFIVCRTFYMSSKITQFLPLYPSHVHEPESLIAPQQVTLITAKAHYARMVAIVNHLLTIRNVIDDYIFFENFYVSFSGYCVLTLALLVVPDHSLMITFLLLGLGVLAGHPEAKTFWLQTRWGPQISRKRRKFKRSDGIMSSWIGSSGLFPSEISVYECERRKWSVSATSLTQFGHTNLRPSESRWLGIFGDPMDARALQSVTIDDKRVIWNSVCHEHTDKNGWEYGRKFPEKNWIELSKEEEREEWSKSYDPVRHRVRRRLWVGEVGGFIEPGELPLSLPETIDAETNFVTNKSHRFFEESSAAESPKSKGLLGRYYRLIEMLYRIQSAVGATSSRIEQLSNIFSWKSRWLTGFFFWIILACIFASALLSANVLVWIIVTIVHYAGYKKWRSRMKRVKFFLKHFKEIVKESNETFRGGVVSELLKLAKFPWKPFEGTEVSKDLINLAVQKTVDKLQLGIPITLNDTKECTCMFELVQLVYMKKKGRKWASREVKSISLGSLLDQHLIGDWELYQTHSVFRNN